MKAEEEEGGGWRIKVKDVGRDTGTWLAFTGCSSCANFGAAARSAPGSGDVSPSFSLFLCAVCISTDARRDLTALWTRCVLLTFHLCKSG